MQKSVKQQYIDLQEGRMSQANFMRNLRMTMPHLVTNVTSFNDSVRILKNKGILSETSLVSLKLEHESNNVSDIIELLFDSEYEDATDTELKYIRAIIDSSNHPDKKAAIDIIDGIMYSNNKDEARAEMKADFDYEASRLNDLDEVSYLSEAKQDEKTGAYNQDGASMYKGFPEGTHVNRQELTKGIKMEHEQNPYEEYEKVVKKVIKNLKKDPNYYTHYQLSGVEGFTPGVIGNVKPSDRTMKFVNGDNMVDKAMGMKPVKDLGKYNPSANKAYSEKHPNKIGKIDLMSLVAQSVRGVKKMDATGEKSKKIKVKESYWMNKPADAEKYQIKKDIKGNIIQATNDEGNRFSKNDIAIAVDNGEKIKISSFIEQQGKVKAIYIVSGTPYTIDIDGLKSVNEFKPGIDLGKAFDKFKGQSLKEKLSQIIREELAEVFDGRDNLTDTAGEMDENDENEN
jgi:hypothetical protein